MLSFFKCHPPLKRTLASCEWGSKWIGPLRIGNELRLIGPTERLRLVLPLGQKGVGPLVHLGNEQCVKISANLQEGFRIANPRRHLGGLFGRKDHVESERIGVLED